MESIHYIGLDVHKKTIAYCIKTVSGKTVRQGIVSAERKALRQWLSGVTWPLDGRDGSNHLHRLDLRFPQAHAVELKVAHPEMLKAITAAKKKNDRADAEKLADLLRVNLLPECTMMSEELRELRRILRYRNLVVRTSRQDEEQDLRVVDGGRGDLRQATAVWPEVFQRITGTRSKMCRIRSRNCCKLSRGNLELFTAVQKKLIKTLREAAPNSGSGLNG